MVEDTILVLSPLQAIQVILQYEFYEEVKTDNSNANTSRVLHASGNRNNGTNTGTFYVNTNSTSNTNANIGSHLKYLISPNTYARQYPKDRIQLCLNS